MPHDESQSITDDINLRCIKNRDGQRKYRARKLLEGDLNRSDLIAQGIIRPAEEISIVSSKFYDQPVSSDVQEKPIYCVFKNRVYSDRRWKKEARQIHSSTRMENVTFWETSAELGSVSIFSDSDAGGRRDWKGDARKKMTKEKPC